MLVQSLMGEFIQEAENTRKLLKAIPDSALGYKSGEKLWSTAQLAAHIAEVYNWYQPILHQNVFDMALYKYDKGDISIAANIVAKFEENFKNAQVAVETAIEQSMYEKWKMVMGNEEPIFPEMPRIQVVRRYLFNHLYHHRGELIVYLRITGNKVPGLYGATADYKM